jgi:hypothetical protein
MVWVNLVYFAHFGIFGPIKIWQPWKERVEMGVAPKLFFRVPSFCLCVNKLSETSKSWVGWKQAQQIELMTNVGAEHRRADIYIGEPVDNATYRNL